MLRRASVTLDACRMFAPQYSSLRHPPSQRDALRSLTGSLLRSRIGCRPHRPPYQPQGGIRSPSNFRAHPSRTNARCRLASSSAGRPTRSTIRFSLLPFNASPDRIASTGATWASDRHSHPFDRRAVPRSSHAYRRNTHGHSGCNDRQRQGGAGGRRSAHAARRLPARQPGPHRHARRLRHGAVRRVHRASRRPRGQGVQRARRAGARRRTS